jgi:hypothetical protein
VAPRKRPWFRFYTETFADLEVRAMPVAHRWVWASLLGLARMSPVPGALLDKAGEPVTDDLLADWAAVRKTDVRAAMRRFVALGMVRTDEGVRVIAKWDARQFESDDVTARTAKHRAKNGRANGDGTFQGDTDGTELPSVRPREPEEQRTEPPPPTSAEPPAELDRGGGGIEAVLTEAARLLAELEADRRGNEIGNRAGYVRARTTAIRREHEAAWRAIAEVAPDVTAEHLANGDGDTAGDRAVHAMRSRIERTDRRKRGDTCPDCDDLGVVDVGDGTFDDCECKTRRSA